VQKQYAEMKHKPTNNLRLANNSNNKSNIFDSETDKITHNIILWTHKYTLSNYTFMLDILQSVPKIPVYIEALCLFVILGVKRK